MSSDTLSADDRKFIDENFENYGSGWSDEGLSGIERDFEISAKVKRRKYLLDLKMRCPAGFEATMTILRPGGELSGTRCVVPKGDKLTKDELAKVNAALEQAASVLLLEPSNSKVISLDLRRGSDGLRDAKLDSSVCYDESNKPMVHPPRELVTRRRGDFACLYFVAKDGWQDPFCLWLRMSGGEVSMAGAAWADVPAPKGGLVAPETYAFLDKAMRENGDFGVYGSVAGGLSDLMSFMEVELKYREEAGGKAFWDVNATPKDGHGHFLGFAIDAKTGGIDGCMAGHLEPEPDFGADEFDPE